LSFSTCLAEQMVTMRVYAQICAAMAKEHASRSKEPSEAL
jgi:hypothetical protein